MKSLKDITIIRLSIFACHWAEISRTQTSGVCWYVWRSINENGPDQAAQKSKFGRILGVS